MKLKFTPYRIYVLSLLLIVTVVWFPVIFLIPKGAYKEDASIYRIPFFIFAAIMLLVVRFLIYFVDRIEVGIGFKRVSGYLFLVPSLLISSLGFFLTYISRDVREYLLFYIVAVYHIFRFWGWGDKHNR